MEIEFTSDLDTLADHIQLVWPELKKHQVILLNGEMGQGKTTFVSHLVSVAGSQDEVSSPTFSIVNIYRIPDRGNGINQIVHMDLYRLTDVEEIIESGINEYLMQPNNFCIIEWPDLILPFLQSEPIRIHIDETENNQRKFLILLPDSIKE